MRIPSAIAMTGASDTSRRGAGAVGGDTLPEVLLWLAFAAAFVGVSRNLMFKISTSQAVVLVSYVAFPIACALFGVATALLVLRHKLLARLQDGYRARLLVWVGLVGLCLVFGVVSGNQYMYLIKETLWFAVVTMFLVLGVNERVWYMIDRPATITFYAALIVAVRYYADVSVVDEVVHGVMEVDESRFTNSIGAAFRPFLSMGLFIAIWGASNERRWWWKVPQVLALFGQVGVNALIFKYRSEFIFGAAVAGLILVIGPALSGRFRPGLTLGFVVLMVGGLIAGLRTEFAEAFIERLTHETQDQGLTTSRLAELEWYWAAYGPRAFIGGGLGAGFDAFGMFQNSESAGYWTTLHFGLLVLTMKGGLPLLLSFASFLVPNPAVLSRSWFRNPCNLTAALLWPVAVSQMTLNPIGLSPEQGCRYALTMMALARFGALGGAAVLPMGRAGPAAALPARATAGLARARRILFARRAWR